ncbi:MAG TPA: S8 family serine peptidase [Gaiellales bacterium]|nr:S8 family serine peptidase [Gaiellales bacterium]
MSAEEDEGPDELPAWSLTGEQAARLRQPAWPKRITRDWAWGGATGKGVRVAIVDSGVEPDHPLVGPVQQAVTIGDPEKEEVLPDTEGDLCGHGTACAGIVRSLAPECEIISVRVLGAGYTGSGPVLMAGLEWAVDSGFELINMSLSTTKRRFSEFLHELADDAYFNGTMIVASAHNMPVESYPWRFSSVLSVGSHDQPGKLTFFYNPSPPVEFFAPGIDLDVPWVGGTTLRCSGNSFATPYMTGICALIKSKHPELTPFQLKSVLHATASNVEEADRE